ncbi:MAG: EamA/RhaT family transporter, partial [Thermoprotei archaeon]
GADATACAFWRTLIAGVIMAAGTIRGSRYSLIKGKYMVYSVLAGVMLSAHFIMWMKSLFMVPVAVSTTIIVTYPLFNALADAVILGETPSKLQILGLILAFTGVVLFIHPAVTVNYSIAGVLLALASALAVAGYFSLGRVVRRKVSLSEYTSIAYLVSAAVTATYAVVAGENIINYPPKAYAYFVLLALVPMLGGHTLMNYLLRYFKTYVVSSLGFMEPVGASILAYLLLKQYVSTYTATSMTLVLAGVFLVIAEESRSMKHKSSGGQVPPHETEEL